MAEDTLQQTGVGQESTLALAGQVMEQARKLVRHELANTTEELRHEIKRMAIGGGLLFSSAWMKLAALGAFSLALVLRSQERPAKGPALAGLGLAVGATVLGLSGLRVLPRHPFAAPMSQVKKGLTDLRSRLS